MVKDILKTLLPQPVWNSLRRGNLKLFELTMEHVQTEEMLLRLNARGLNVSRVSDFYSPLPVVSQLEKNLRRWFKPSEMRGVAYDLEAMKQLLVHLVSTYCNQYKQLPPYSETKKIGYGPGFTAVDAMIFYCMLRDIKPRRYIEIGSGLSTWYCSVAGEHNAREGHAVGITCVDPYAFEKLYDIPGIEIIKKEAQELEASFFERLQAGDILFIDGTHIVKIDGDVPYLYLEALPRLKKGVIIHIHDIHFPYNVPYPPQCYIFGGWQWPVFWTEAMLLQAFLCHNSAFRIKLSAPLLRHYSEDFLKKVIPDYTPLDPANMDTHFGSIWLEKVL